jgi:GH24 family phage-related lysozyme (muramidase)
MTFNLGKLRLAGFRRMRAAINRGNWQGAADEAENNL